MCYYPERQKERQKVKYLVVKQCVSGVIVRVTPYVIILFWRPLFLLFSIFISIANFAKLKGSLNIRVLQYVVQNPAAVGLFHVFHKVYS